MSPIVTGHSALRARMLYFGALCAHSFRRCSPVWLAGLLLLAVSPLRAQIFDPSVTVGAGIQAGYDHSQPSGGTAVDQFALDHARIYLSGTITKDISVMFNTDYDSVTNKIGILDAAAQFDVAPMFNVWVGRFIAPSDRANLYGPFYSNEAQVFTDGIQDGYPFVFQGRDNGAMYWGDFKESIAKIKVSVGAFDGASLGGGDAKVLFAGRVQVDFWDPEGGYYLNGTYYGDKNLLAIGGATETQSDKTATTVDFLMEKKIPNNGGAVSIESEFADYNRLGGYNSNYRKSEGAYILAAYLFPQQVGIGKFQVLGKFALAEFTDGIPVMVEIPALPPNSSYRQKTTEIDVNYIIKEFDARISSFFKDVSYTGINVDTWEAGVGVQLQISKTIK